MLRRDLEKDDSFSNRELYISVVCSSNQNRSMEAHNFLRHVEMNSVISVNKSAFVCVKVNFESNEKSLLTSLLC